MYFSVSWHAYMWTWWHSFFFVRVSAGSVVHCVRACWFGLSVIRKQCPGWSAVIMIVTSGDFALHRNLPVHPLSPYEPNDYLEPKPSVTWLGVCWFHSLLSFFFSQVSRLGKPRRNLLSRITDILSILLFFNSLFLLNCLSLPHLSARQ